MGKNISNPKLTGRTTLKMNPKRTADITPKSENVQNSQQAEAHDFWKGIKEKDRHEPSSFKKQPKNMSQAPQNVNCRQMPGNDSRNGGNHQQTAGNLQKDLGNFNQNVKNTSNLPQNQTNKRLWEKPCKKLETASKVLSEKYRK